MEKELEKRTCPDLQVYMDERRLENPCKFLGSRLIIEERLTDSQAFWLQPNAFVLRLRFVDSINFIYDLFRETLYKSSFYFRSSGLSILSL